MCRELHLFGPFIAAVYWQKRFARQTKFIIDVEGSAQHNIEHVNKAYSCYEIHTAFCKFKALGSN
jgi:hypothetical protein